MWKKVYQWFLDSLGPGIPTPEKYEPVVDRTLREKARAIASDAEAHTYKEAVGILMAFQLDAEQERRELFARVRLIEYHWIFRRATLMWIMGQFGLNAWLVLAHLNQNGWNTLERLVNLFSK